MAQVTAGTMDQAADLLKLEITEPEDWLGQLAETEDAKLPSLLTVC